MTLTVPEARLYEPRALENVETTDNLSMIHGRAVPYGVRANVGWYLETMQAGAFGKSIRESARALPLLLFHDAQTFPIGAAEKWDEKDDGLYGTWKLDDSPEAQRAARQARDGLLNFFSVGFMPVEGRTVWELDEALGLDHAIRKEARLLEVSLVSTPAYKDATVTWVRSATPRKARRRPTRDAWVTELEKLRR